MGLAAGGNENNGWYRETNKNKTWLSVGVRSGNGNEALGRGESGSEKGISAYLY